MTMRFTLQGAAALAASMLLCSIPARAQDMPKSVAEAAQMERATALPITALYSTRLVAQKSKPGDLLAHESFSDYALPVGITAVRIIYHSLDADGRGVATSGVVLIPKGSPPKDGWPIIAWAHGTSGVAQQCAPSLMKDVYYGGEGLFAFLAAGFAVVATDYHGLGTPGRHQYVDKIAQAQDVLYSVPAARAAVHALGRRWVADGHSQGGLAAWGVAELEAELHDPDYLGAVSVAGALRLHDLLIHLGNTPGVGFYLAFMAYGIHARFPEFQPSEMLTPSALSLYPAATTKGCWYNGYATYHDLPSTAMLLPNWDSNSWVQSYFSENALGEKSVEGPLFVIAGEADTTVPIDGVRALVRRACDAGAAVNFRSYPHLDHDPAMQESVPDQLAWIRDRFARKLARRNCPAK